MMETGTFLIEDVKRVIEEYFVPLKFESGRDAEQFLRFRIKGTPTVIFLDGQGNELHRILGFLEAGDLIPQLERVRTM